MRWTKGNKGRRRRAHLVLYVAGVVDMDSHYRAAEREGVPVHGLLDGDLHPRGRPVSVGLPKGLRVVVG
jgi:hypothetical protein